LYSFQKKEKMGICKGIFDEINTNSAFNCHFPDFLALVLTDYYLRRYSTRADLKKINKPVWLHISIIVGRDLIF
jgi:hypothetical protein